MHCALETVHDWMSANRLRLNPSKSQFIWFGTTRARCRIDKNALASASLAGQSCNVVRDLGVLLDGGLTMADHVTHISRISYYELRQIRVIRRMLSLSAAAVLIHSFVLTRLDYCNGVLLGLPEFRLHRNRNRNLQTSKALLESQAQGTSLFTSAASSQRGCPKE